MHFCAQSRYIYIYILHLDLIISDALSLSPGSMTSVLPELFICNRIIPRCILHKACKELKIDVHKLQNLIEYLQMVFDQDSIEGKQAVSFNLFKTLYRVHLYIRDLHAQWLLTREQFRLLGQDPPDFKLHAPSEVILESGQQGDLLRDVPEEQFAYWFGMATKYASKIGEDPERRLEVHFLTCFAKCFAY